MNMRMSLEDMARLDALHRRTMPIAPRAMFALAVLRAGLTAAETSTQVLIDDVGDHSAPAAPAEPAPPRAARAARSKKR
jgi:hypothetical protein